MGRKREFDEAEVLNCVEEHFWRHGYRATSMQELAAATGVKPGSFFKCFGNKRDVYLAALNHYAEMHSPKAQLLRLFDAPLIDSLRGLFDEVIERTERGGPPGCMVSNHVGELNSIEDDVAEPSINLMRAAQRLIRLRLQWAREQGELAGSTDIDSLAAHLFCTLQGLYVLSASIRDGEDMRRARDAALSVVERLLAPAAEA
jgi:TetR/AcrR family transcriptional repressor of nem operon